MREFAFLTKRVTEKVSGPAASGIRRSDRSDEPTTSPCLDVLEQPFPCPLLHRFLARHPHSRHCGEGTDYRTGRTADNGRSRKGGYLKRERVGRQNHYRLEPGLHLRHPLEHHVEVGRLLAVLQPGTSACELLVQNPQESAVVTARGLNAAPSRADAKAISRLKKRPRKPGKLIAKKSV